MGAKLFRAKRTNGQAYMTKLIVPFSNCSKAPKKEMTQVRLVHKVTAQRIERIYNLKNALNFQRFTYSIGKKKETPFIRSIC